MKRALFVVISMLAGGPASADSLPINGEAVVLNKTLGCDADTLRSILDRDRSMSETVERGYVNRLVETGRCGWLYSATPVTIADNKTLITQRSGMYSITRVNTIAGRRSWWVLSAELAAQ